MKTAMHVTVDKTLADWIDSNIEEGTYASRSHAVNTALKELRKKGTVKL